MKLYLHKKWNIMHICCMCICFYVILEIHSNFCWWILFWNGATSNVGTNPAKVCYQWMINYQHANILISQVQHEIISGLRYHHVISRKQINGKIWCFCQSCVMCLSRLVWIKSYLKKVTIILHWCKTDQLRYMVYFIMFLQRRFRNKAIWVLATSSRIFISDIAILRSLKIYWAEEIRNKFNPPFPLIWKLGHELFR